MIQMMDLRLVYMYKFLNLCSSLRICVLNLLEYQVGKVMSAHSESFVWRTDGPGLID
jgi:predicted DNA-binding ribbon-helix-helix protein